LFAVWPNAYTDTNGISDSHTYSHSDCDSYSHSYGNSDAVHGKMCTNTEVATYAGAAAHSLDTRIESVIQASSDLFR